MAHDHDRQPGLWDGTRSAGSAAAGARVHSLFAVTAARFNADDPLAALELGEHAAPAPPGGGGTPAARRPRIIGWDAAGREDDGRGVGGHSVVGAPAAGGADETMD